MPRYKLWVMENKEKIPINKMSDEHLINTINMLIRKAETDRATAVKSILSFPEPSGGMAELYFEKDLNSSIESDYGDFLPKIYWDMYEIACKRGIADRIIDPTVQTVI